jgi:hypothetical protein
LSRISRPQDDVNILATDFVANRCNSGTTQADTGTDRIDTRVVGLDGDLRTQTGITGTGLQFHQTIGDFRHFHVEKFDNKIRGSA